MQTPKPKLQCRSQSLRTMDASVGIDRACGTVRWDVHSAVGRNCMRSRWLQTPRETQTGEGCRFSPNAFNTVTVNISARFFFFVELDKIIFKCTQRGKGTGGAKVNLETREVGEAAAHLEDALGSYRGETAWCGWTGRHTHRRLGSKSQKQTTGVYPPEFRQGTKAIQ